jgi:chaperone required for assembly of F1-ATPase
MYLSLMLAKGFKNEFDPIIDWIREISDLKTHIIDLCLSVEDDGETLFQFLNIFRSGLVSRNGEVAKICSRFYSNLTQLI